MNASSIRPRRGEIWMVQLDPVRGSEQGKTRPVVVLSQPPIGRPSVRLGVPVTNYKPEHLDMVWCAALEPDTMNGLNKESTADTSQTRALDLARFEAPLGRVSAANLEEIKAALISAIGYSPK